MASRSDPVRDQRCAGTRRVGGPLATARAAAAATPPGRDRYVDFLRVASIAVVVFGHWLMVFVTRSGGQLSGGNVLAVTPGLWLATWVLQVMPVFFFVGGFSNLASWDAARRQGGGYGEWLAGRAIRLLRPLLAFVVVWLVLAVALELLGVPRAQVAAAGKLIAQPLWFVAVYLVVVALAPAMARLHRRAGLRVVVVLAAGVAVVDATRIGLGLRPAGYLNLLLVWALVQQLGFFYADGSLGRLPRRALVRMAAAGLLTLVGLTSFGLYPPSMVGLPGEPFSNMSPPTACIVALAVWQVALLMLARERVSRWLARHGPWTAVVSVGSLAMTLYLWHLTALALLVGLLLAVGAPLPAPGGATWWLSRPLWLALLLVVLAPLALFLARFERPARTRAPRGAAGPVPAVLGAALAVAGVLSLVVSGLAPLDGGPGSIPLALGPDPLRGLLCLLVAACLLRAARHGAPRSPAESHEEPGVGGDLERAQ